MSLKKLDIKQQKKRAKLENKNPNVDIKIENLFNNREKTPEVTENLMKRIKLDDETGLISYLKNYIDLEIGKVIVRLVSHRGERA